MYEIFDTTTRKVVALADEPHYVYRSPRNGVWIRCDEEDAECIAVEGTRYSIRGKEPVPDAPNTVAVRKADAAKRLRDATLEVLEHSKTIEDFKAMFADFADAIIDLYSVKAEKEEAADAELDE